MSENACCAHLRIRYKTEEDHEGLTSGWWECELCAMRFEPYGYLHPRLAAAEERARVAGEAWAQKEREHKDELAALHEQRRRLTAELASLRTSLAEAEEELAWEMNARMDAEVYRDNEMNINDILQHELEQTRSTLTAIEERAKDAKEELREKCAAIRVLERELEDDHTERYRLTALNENLIRRLREKPVRDMDELIAAFCAVYTSPAWGGDERSPEGWKQKEAALRKAFTSASHDINDKLVAAEMQTEKALGTCRMILRERDTALAGISRLTAEAEKAWQMYERARKERADVLMVKSVEGLTMSEWQLRLAKTEAELREYRRTSVPVGVLLRWMDTRSWDWDTSSDEDMEDLREMLTRRSSIVVNEKGGER